MWFYAQADNDEELKRTAEKTALSDFDGRREVSPWVYFYYGFLAGGGVLLSGLGLWFVAILPGFDRWSTRFFRCYYGILILNCLTSICELTAYSLEAELDVIYWIMGLESFFLSLPLPLHHL